MSLKDVIMTLNEFYSVKLEAILSFVTLIKQEQFDKLDEVLAIEKTVKDNEVWIPYDEEIFVGIDRNYKTLKKISTCMKEVFTESNWLKEEVNYKEELAKLQSLLS